MKKIIVVAFLILSSSPAALKAGVHEDLSAEASGQLSGLLKTTASFARNSEAQPQTAPLPQPVQGPITGSPAPGLPGIYSRKNFYILDRAKEHLETVSKKLEMAGYLVLNSGVSRPDSGWGPPRDFHCDIGFVAPPGGVTHTMMASFKHGIQSEREAQEAVGGLKRELEAAGNVVVFSEINGSFCEDTFGGPTPPPSWGFEIKYVLRAYIQ